MKKKVGVIVDSHSIPKYVLDTINNSQNSDIYEITTLLINDNKKNNFLYLTFDYIKRKGLKRLINAVFFKALVKLEALFSPREKVF